MEAKLTHELDRFFVNMRPEPIEFFLSLAHFALFVWFIIVSLHPISAGFTTLIQICPLFVWGGVSFLIGTIQLLSAIQKWHAIRRMTAFSSFCFWVLIGISVFFGTSSVLPPYFFLFAFSAGWIYVKLNIVSSEDYDQ